MSQITTSPSSANMPVKILMVIGLIILQGCNQEIDARQVRVEQGLIYKKDASDPFTGTIINVNIAEVVKKYVTLLLTLDGSCVVPVKNGLFDGEAICKSTTGKKIAEMAYSQGHQNGVFKAWGIDNDNLVLSMSLRDGVADGVMERYNTKTGKIISRITYLAGEKSGEEKRWDITGETLLTDLTWENGVQTGVYRDGGREEHYKGGVPNGTWKICQWAGSLSSEKRQAYNAKEFSYSGFAQQLGGTYSLSAIADSASDIECFEEIYTDGIKKVAVVNSEPGSSEDACLQSKIVEFHKEIGDDSPISSDMIEEWKGQCRVN